VGNKDMSSWSDLAKITTGPPVNIKDDAKYFTYHRSGTGPVIATARPIGNTEWILLVEFPQRTILSAARNYAGWILIIGSIITLTGIIIAWFMSRNITRPLKKLMGATTAIASGDYNIAVASDRRDEVGALARSFNKMSEQIKNATKNLEQKVTERTAQLEAVNKEAEEAQQQHLQQKLINETSIKVQERVREEIGRELHDNINQLLAASKLYMDYAINKDGIRSEKLEQSRDNIRRAIDEIRKISKALVAPSLGDETLEEVIEDLLRDIRHTTSLKVKLITHNYNEDAINDEIKLALYRIVQEQMNNILKHANAGNVIISLTTANDEARLSIKDDGAGFDTSKNSSGIGLRNITTRASHYDGEVSIYSSAGNGCTLEVMIPM
jgi:signal transduction histidine kinase